MLPESCALAYRTLAYRTIAVWVAVVLLLGLSRSTTQAQAASRFADSARVQIDMAVLANDTARLGQAELLLDRALTAFPNDPHLLHYRGYASYRRALDHFRTGNPQSAAPFIQDGIADLERSSDKLPWPESFALLATLHSLRIALDPALGQSLEMELSAMSARAAALGPRNPRVLLLRAMVTWKTPPEYGGGVERARPILDAALRAFADDRPAALAPQWGREEAAALLQEFVKGSP